MRPAFVHDGWGGIDVYKTHLDQDEVKRLVREWSDGLCPACFEEINDGAIVCDGCLERAQSFRRNGPPVDARTTGPDWNDPKYRKPGKNFLFKDAQ